MSAAFSPGERVRVKALYPPGHLRTPHYVRGKSGVVERVLEAFANPEERAYARDGLPAKWLYRVRFAQNHIWADYAGGVADTVDIEIFEHWLEPA